MSLCVVQCSCNMCERVEQYEMLRDRKGEKEREIEYGFSTQHTQWQNNGGTGQQQQLRQQWSQPTVRPNYYNEAYNRPINHFKITINHVVAVCTDYVQSALAYARRK